jgi:hypothetical protein
MAAWALKDAEISCDKVFERAFGGEPQVVTRYGVPSLVVITYADFTATRKKSKCVRRGGEGKSHVKTPLDVFRSCPVDLSELIDEHGEELPSAFDRAGCFNSEEYA